MQDLIRGTTPSLIVDFSDTELSVTDITQAVLVITQAGKSRNVFLSDLSVDTEAVQTGSGDPSPSNVRAITGWNTVKVARTRQNLLPVMAETTTSLHRSDVKGKGGLDGAGA